MLIPLKGADLYEKVKKLLHSVCIPILELDELVTDGAPSMVRRNSGVSLLETPREPVFEIPEKDECC